MKVILTEEVVGLGEPGKLVDVAPGYARNYLVPRKLAVYADTGSLKEMEHHKRRLDRKRDRLQAAAMSTSERINGQTLTIEGHAGKENKLYGSVTSADIAEALQKQFGVTVDRRRIHLKEPIRMLGTYPVDVHIMGETHATVNVNVVDTTHPQPVAPAPAAEAPAAEVPAETPAAAEETGEE